MKRNTIKGPQPGDRFTIKPRYRTRGLITVSGITCVWRCPKTVAVRPTGYRQWTFVIRLSTLARIAEPVKGRRWQSWRKG